MADELILPGGKRARGPRRVLDIPAGQSPVIDPQPGTLIQVDDVALHFLEAGPFIIVPLERWQRTLARAVATEQAAIERVSRQVRRATARQISRDANN